MCGESVIWLEFALALVIVPVLFRLLASPFNKHPIHLNQDVSTGDLHSNE